MESLKARVEFLEGKLEQVQNKMFNIVNFIHHIVIIFIVFTFLPSTVTNATIFLRKRRVRLSWGKS